MRVTDKLMFDRAASRTEVARDTLQRAIAETSSGRRIEHPGDDAAASGLVVGHQLARERLEAIRTVAGRASDEVVGADQALLSVSEAFSRARALAVQLSNDTYDAGQRAGAATEVRALFQQTVGLMNTRVGNRYLFGGTEDGAPPFDATGAYLGDDGVRQVEILPGVMQPVSVRADRITKGVDGGTDLFATLDALADALESNDPEAVRATLSGLDQGISQLSVGLAQNGAAMNDLDTVVAVTREGADSETAAMARLTDADIIESASRMALAEKALEATLAAAARSFDLSLLNRLR